MNIHISPGVYFQEKYIQRGRNPKFFHKRHLKRKGLTKQLLVSSNTNNTPINHNSPVVPFDVTMLTLSTNIADTQIVFDDMIEHRIGVFIQMGNNFYYYMRVCTTGLNGFLSYDYQTQIANHTPPITFRNINEGEKMTVKVIKAYDKVKDLNDLIEEKPIDSEYYTHTIIINGNEYHNTSIIEIPITDKTIDLRIERLKIKHTT